MSKNIALVPCDNGYEIIGRDVDVKPTTSRVCSKNINGVDTQFVYVTNMLYPDHRFKFTSGYKQLIGEAMDNIKAGYGDFMYMNHGSIYVGEVIDNDDQAKKLNDLTMKEWGDKHFKYIIEKKMIGLFGRYFVKKMSEDKDILDICYYDKDFPGDIITFDSYDEAQNRINMYEEKAKQVIDCVRTVTGAEAQYEVLDKKLKEMGERYSGSLVEHVLNSAREDWSLMPLGTYPSDLTSDLTISQIPIDLKK